MIEIKKTSEGYTVIINNALTLHGLTESEAQGIVEFAENSEHEFIFINN